MVRVSHNLQVDNQSLSITIASLPLPQLLLPVVGMRYVGYLGGMDNKSSMRLVDSLLLSLCKQRDISSDISKYCTLTPLP